MILLCLKLLFLSGIKHIAQNVAARKRQARRNIILKERSQKNILSPAGLVLARAMAEQLTLHVFISTL